jgi:hypothetical protein
VCFTVDLVYMRPWGFGSRPPEEIAAEQTVAAQK